MRTNAQGVTEVASIRTNQDKYNEGWDRIFGNKKLPCRCQDKERDLTFCGVEVVCGTCNRVLSTKCPDEA